MGMTSWKKEFYSKTAEHVTKTGSKKTLLKHSLRKWEGLTDENIKKHGLTNIYGNLSTEDERFEFGIDASSCALCEKYYNSDLDENRACEVCPLYQHLGKRCDDENQPFDIWRDVQDPSRMIQALKECLEKLD